MPVHKSLDDNPEFDFYETADDVFDKLRALVDQPEPPKDVAAFQIQAMALVARIRHLSRTAVGATRQKKDATGEARQEMDQSHLGLQNLLYEKRHLEREIEKCRQFASIYQDVPLHSLEEFKALAPEEARSDKVLEDEHQLMLNRLSFELAERQRLEQRRRELIKQKEDMLRESKLRAGTLDAVKSQIDLLVKAAAEAQKKVQELVTPIQNEMDATPT